MTEPAHSAAIGGARRAPRRRDGAFSRRRPNTITATSAATYVATAAMPSGVLAASAIVPATGTTPTKLPTDETTYGNGSSVALASPFRRSVVTPPFVVTCLTRCVMRPVPPSCRGTVTMSPFTTPDAGIVR